MRQMLLIMILGFSLICYVVITGTARERQPANVTFAYTSATQDQEKNWTVIEYPENREVTVELRPTALMPDVKGTAKVMRGADETTVQVEISGVTGEAAGYKLYAVDHRGSVSLLGEVPISDGTGTLNVKTPLYRFMLVLSPEADLTAVGADTPLLLRSAVPEGFEVLQMVGSDAERAAAEESASSAPAYDAPLLGISELKRGSDTALKVDFASDLEGVRATASVKPQKGGATQIKVQVYNLKSVSENIHYVLWAVNGEHSYSRLAQIAAKGKRNEAKVEVKTMLPDFGLLITAEESEEPASPTGTLIAKLIR